MRVLGACEVSDALAAWGSHNPEWRLGRAVRDRADAVEVALTYYSFLVSLILLAQPLACLRAELDASDLPDVRTAGNQPFGEWAAAVERDQTRSGADVRAMVADPAWRFDGSLVCARLGAESADGVALDPTTLIVVYDGWHRGAAEPVAAFVVATRRPPAYYRA